MGCSEISSHNSSPSQASMMMHVGRSVERLGLLSLSCVEDEMNKLVGSIRNTE
jgi:chemotaxis protein CheY-P-specific phosphatase CheC